MPDEGTRGSQSVLVVWAEQALVVHDEFREGNVPAGCGTVRVLARAVASLPGGLTQIFVRGGIAPWMHQRGSPGVSSQSGGAGRPSVPTGVRTCEPRSRGYRSAPGSQTVTNRAGEGLTLIRWHREQAGTVEPTQHGLKNEWAAAALPSGKCGAHAAWVRLTILTDNRLSAVKRRAFPGDVADARPMRWRFLVCTTVGTGIQQARRTR